MPLPKSLSSSWSVQIYSLANHRDRGTLLRILKKTGAWGVPLKRIYDLLTLVGDEKGRLCKSVILETQYIDRDFADAYSKLYGRSFYPYGRMCYRLHFFSRDFGSAEDLHIQSYSQERARLEALQQEYQGFCVIHPSQPDIVGRTVITPPISQDHDQYLLCREEYGLNLAGLQLKAHGSPFIQQDCMVGACATAATWMAHMALFKRYGLPTYSTTQITEIADMAYPSPERVFPSEGLTVEQIGVALKRMGHETIILDIERTNPEAARHSLYHYVESSIPIVLGVKTQRGRHAMTIVGHTLSTHPLRATPPVIEVELGAGMRNFRYHAADAWITGLCLNDDQRGPYRTAEIPITRNARRTHIKMKDFPRSGVTTNFQLLAAIIPLPQHVYLLGDMAETKAAIMLSVIEALGLIDASFAGQNFVLRTLLRESNRFKTSLDVTERDVPADLVWTYQKRHLPKYVWLIEISTLQLWNVNVPDKRIIGEILVDPTSNPNRLDAIVANIAGHVWDMKPDDADILAALRRDPIIIANWHPYKCLQRNSS